MFTKINKKKYSKKQYNNNNNNILYKTYNIIIIKVYKNNLTFKNFKFFKRINFHY